MVRMKPRHGFEPPGKGRSDIELVSRRPPHKAERWPIPTDGTSLLHATAVSRHTITRPTFPEPHPKTQRTKRKSHPWPACSIAARPWPLSTMSN